MAIACSLSAWKPPLEEALRRVAALGFRHVDLLAIRGFASISAADLAADWNGQAQRVEQLLAANGLSAVSLNAAVGHLHRRTDPAANAQRLKEVDALARLMRRLGTGVASFYPGYLCNDRPWEDVLRDTCATLREMLDIARTHGVRFGVELHYDTPFMLLEQGRRLLEVLPELGVVYDPSHFAMQRIDLRRTEPFLDRTIHVHLRSAAPGRMQARVAEGTVDFDWLLGALRKRGYEGHFSIEYLPSPDADMLPEILATREIVRRYFPEPAAQGPLTS